MSWNSSDSHDDSCSDEEGEECPEMTLLGNVIFYWVLAGFMTSLCLRLKYSSFAKPFVDRIGILRSVANRFEQAVRNPGARALLSLTQFCLEMVISTLLGPLPLAALLCWYFHHFYVVVPRQAARERAVERLRRFPGQRRWHAGGWLIMIRTRHQRSLARPKGWPIRLRKLERYNEANIVHKIPPELELLEAGRSRMNFVRAVTAVVEINEEGLFRHIISFL
ncbi:unnamed protein product [Ectocarpus sp. 6 AP-2014]